jgi:hypothetical protein
VRKACGSLRLCIDYCGLNEVGLEYLAHFPVRGGCESMLVKVDHFTRKTHFLPCTQNVTREESASLLLKGVDINHGMP